MDNRTKILLIEDNSDIREIMKDMLSMKGYDVYEAEDGPLGIQTAIAKKPNLIICDLMMPEMDGFEVLLSLRKINAFSNIPFIIVTAKVDSIVHREAMALGADDFITKPFSANDLLDSVKTRIEKFEVLSAGKGANEDYLFPAKLNLDQITTSAELLMKFGKEMNQEEAQMLYKDIHRNSFRISKQLDNLWIHNLMMQAGHDEALELYYKGSNVRSVNSIIRDTLRNELFSKENELDLDSELVHQELNIPRKALKKVMLEVLDNAFSHSDEGTKVYIETEKSDDQLILHIRNRNSKISQDEILEITPFSPFQASSDEGLFGLGLYISHEIISLYGGSVKFEKGKDNWSNTTVCIPFAS